MLILPIKKKWFDMIVSGEKKEEYREIKPYYDSRFMNAFGFLLAGGQMVYGEAAPEEIRKPWPVPVSIQKWILEGLSGNCLQMHFAIWRR